MLTEKERAWEAYQSRKRAYQSVYDNFRYTDAQREQVIEFIGAAMKVIRGDAEFESLKRLLPIARTRVEEVDSQAYRGGNRYAFDARFLNDWTSIYMLGTTDAQGKVEPYHFQIYFRPEMTIPRERLEQLLQLKVGPGWIPDGGNLQTPEVMLHGGGVRQPATFEYSILNPPHAPYTVHVKLSYLKGDRTRARTRPPSLIVWKSAADTSGPKKSANVTIRSSATCRPPASACPSGANGWASSRTTH
ncbi:hypothetical protein [Variovorax sp. GT1P44]|uniref:hypothetical protein n=1 Tax=Variovorax sp. GT1P44 TaxID=3443742 RepID=UPI003F45338D